MHVFLWDAKGSELYMWPFIQQFCGTSIPLSAMVLGFRNHDGWMCVYLGEFVVALLETDPSTN